MIKDLLKIPFDPLAVATWQYAPQPLETDICVCAVAEPLLPNSGCHAVSWKTGNPKVAVVACVGKKYPDKNAASISAAAERDLALFKVIRPDGSWLGMEWQELASHTSGLP